MPTPNDDINNDDINSSPSGEETPFDDSGEGSEGGDGTPHKKDAEARIHELLAKNKEFEEKLKTMEEKMAPPPPPTFSTGQEIKPEVKRAVEYLKGLGFTDEDILDKKIEAVENKLALQLEHQRLESRFNGEDGRPKYNKAEVDKYMRDNSIFNPEVAYKALHETELLDFAFKEAEKKKTAKPYVEKAGTTPADRSDNVITREEIKKRMDAGDRVWYERNREKILSLTRQGQL